ncbi:MAG: hypothetical protein MUF60_05840, partial [Vicinamibacterales bacterium]|nr:hypothetical protein [Vicinamibacterales bacterium]
MAAPATATAGRVTAVTPARVSADATLNISATGLDAAAANNRVTFTPQGGSPVDTLAMNVGTVDAAAGVRRIGVRVPRGLPAGLVSLRVTNLASGEVTDAGAVQVVVLELLPASLTQGTGPADIVIRTSPNGQFAAAGTRATFGPGVTVHSLRVDSPTQLTVSISVNPTAPLGRLTVATLSSGQTAVAPEAFEIRAQGSGPGNTAPVITSTPTLTATVGQPYAYTAAATDADADPVSFFLVSGPAGFG